ncbi:hypothetical protein [Paenibacillus sp. N3.4]|uniref:hypothetical protein n=1 Tax=Paenibacillus sp. N3.4 TaxID=2603222 RepID=UPI0011C74BA2|nr:hypothetical protein [Paenibacillus sp. N3.4]TXK74811.1 hypothetical protein FU659_28350 [Paenibacillus sp. N3.4]
MYTNPSQHQGQQGQPIHHGQHVPYGHQQGHHVIYQADGSWQPLLKQQRDHIWGTLHPHIGHTIRVTNIDGHTHEGVLAHVDGQHAYLHVNPHGHYYPGHPQQGQHRALFSQAASNQILTLVLYELLVITLLYL